MLAVKNGHKDIVFILTNKGANLELVNSVSFHVIFYMTNSVYLKIKYKSFFVNFSHQLQYLYKKG